jgi:dihydropteroate synthase
MPTTPRRFADLVLDRPLLMGVVNVTPDSFSDGGRFFDLRRAVDHGLRLRDEGSAIIDVGGESTRPGATTVPAPEELRRVTTVVEELTRAGCIVSIDTRRAVVMRAALDAGARIVNDVTALQGDRESLDVVARSGASVVLMHMQGEPQSMQHAPRYDDVVSEVATFLADRVAACRAVRMSDERIAVDPGIGFGKSLEHNVTLLRNLRRVVPAGAALLVGASRKSFIGNIARVEAAADRLPGSLAAALAAVENGADILRVHDIAATRQALDVWARLRGAG